MCPKYPPALSTMVIWSQYVQRSWILLELNPYAARISSHLSQSRSSYSLWKSKNTLKRTNSLMDLICWSRLDLEVSFPIPQPAQNPFSTSWNLTAVVSRWFRRLVTVFQSTSTITIPLKSPIAPLGIRTTVCRMLSSARSPSRNDAWKMATTFWQLVASGVSSRVASINHWRRCSAYISNGPPKQFRQSLCTAQAIYSSSRMESSTGKGWSYLGIGCTGGGTCRYSLTHSAIMLAIATIAGVGRRPFFFLVPYPNPDPCLLNKRRIGCDEGLHCRPRPGRSLSPVLLENRLIHTAECPGDPMVPVSACLNPDVGETPGYQWNPCLMEALQPRWIVNRPPKLIEHAVYPVQGRWRLYGEVCPLPEVVWVRGRRSSTEATQYQVNICVVLCVLDRHVLEHTEFCDQDVVGPGAHFLSFADHVPRPTDLQPQFVPWEEVSYHVLKTWCGHRCRNLLFPLLVLWHCQFGVEIADHLQPSPPGTLTGEHEDPLLLRLCMGPSSTPRHTTAGCLNPAGSWRCLRQKSGAPPQRSVLPHNRTRWCRWCAHSAPPKPSPCNHYTSACISPW